MHMSAWKLKRLALVAGILAAVLMFYGCAPKPGSVGGRITPAGVMADAARTDTGRLAIEGGRPTPPAAAGRR